VTGVQDACRTRRQLSGQTCLTSAEDTIQSGYRDNPAMNKVRGLTLVELLVTLAIAAILVTLAAPSFTRLIQSTKISGNVNTFMSDLRFARSEAVRRGGAVTMCRSSNPEAITASGPTCGTGSSPGWESGWIIFVDQDNDGTRDYNAAPNLDDTILRVQGPITNIDSIAEGGAATAFRFTANGRLLNLSSATQIQFGGAEYANSVQRVLCVNLGGRARIAGDGTTSCGTAGL
jgi:type IV fimbrial biogenesis protein FimT